jgi:serine/threonine-protein kinase
MATPKNIGKYRIEGVLGRGGMGTVYKAFDPAIRRLVALKTISKASLDPSELQYVLARFRHEAQAVGRLTHPGIAAIYDYGEDVEVAYIVMELVNGKSLFQRIQSESRMELKEIGDIVGQLLDALGYAHAQGVVHRDIKPSNILIGEDGRIKITDFGIARIESSRLTQVGEIMGSPGYMSPEQFLGTEIDPRSDLYSVGVIAYELLAGKRPFTGNDAEVMRQVLNENPVNPSHYNPEISVQLDWAVQKALSKKRDDRFQTARDFAEAFARGIQASVRQRRREAPTTGIEDATTQRIDPELMEAAQALVNAREARAEASAAAQPEPVAVGSIATEAALKKARVLFVDDEERILSGLRSVFRHRYRVFTAANGAEALEFVQKFRPHVVVSDQRMPGMTGVELLRKVKEAAPATVRILLTGYADLAAMVGSINEGEVFRFIAKPWDNRELQKTIAEAAAIGLELAEIPQPPPERAVRLDAGILVIDTDEEIHRAVKELFAARCPVFWSRNLDEGFAVLREREIALVLFDVEQGGEEVVTTFKLLKREHPQILTTVLTRASDSDLMFKLINQVQVFRFLNKPVDLKLLRQDVQAALDRYQALRSTPELARLQRAAGADAEDDPSLAAKVLERVRSVKGWFGAKS